jgi:predicted metal-dependent phosphotriesterase family hydrolase
MSFVRTVLGDIPAADLGVTYCHEHLLTRPGEHLFEGGNDTTLDDQERVAAEMRLFKQAGGESLVELSAAEYGRDAAGLAELSEKTGVNVVAATGHTMEGYWAGVLDIASRTDEELYQEMLSDVTVGFAEARGVRAGVIKVGTSRDRATHDEVRMLRAAAAVQRATGVPISTHTSGGTIGLEQVRIFEDAGADLEHVIIGHQDLRLDVSDHLAIVRSGCRIGYDSLSKEKYRRDADVITMIRRLIDEGYSDRICLSGDIARRSYFTSWGGGPGMTYILWRFVPWLHQAGVSPENTHRLLIENPRDLFSFGTGNDRAERTVR